jgi:cytochrome b561
LARRASRRQALSYSPLQKALHWIVVVLCATQVPTSWAIDRTHVAHAAGNHPDPTDMLLHQVHAWTGWVILACVILRVYFRIRHGAPHLPSDTPRWSLLASTVSHAALYATLLALPATGTLAMYVSGAFAPVHQLLTRLLLVLVLVHVGAALWHLALRRDGVVEAMLPSGRSKPAKHGFATR